MAGTSCSAFSHDGKYLAHCGSDGKLKIWETATSRLKQEYTPNLHLSSPCSVLAWISVTRQSTSNSVSPWKKRKRKSVTEEPESIGMVAMGSVNGNVILYDVAAAAVSKQLEVGHTGVITAIDWSDCSGLFTAAEDKMIIHWNIQDDCVKAKFKSGKEKVTAIAIVHGENSIISAGKTIKWWDLSTQRVITSFTGHTSYVTSLNPIKMNGKSIYLISGASGDRQLNIWSLNKENKDRNSVAILVMQDEATSVTAQVVAGSQVEVLAVTRSGKAHLFKHQPNGRGSKPLKPTLEIVVNSTRGQKETVQQIQILTAKLTEDSQLLLAYGSYLNVSFEKVTPDFSEKVQCLMRLGAKISKERNDLAVSKIKPTEVDGEVQYLTTGTATPIVKRSRSNAAGSQLPMEIRLENLSLKTAANTPGEAPTKATNMAQLLMQGLHSKDKTILRDVLMRRDETLIKNTVSRLPVETIAPLLKELTILMQGKAYTTKIAITWLKMLVQHFAGHLLSYPDIGDLLGPILGTVDAKLSLLPQLCRLKGRVALVTGQITQAAEKRERINEESLLVYQEPDSSDDDTEVEELATGSESDDIWEEASDQEANQEADETHHQPGDNDDEDDNDESVDEDVGEDSDNISMSS